MTDSEKMNIERAKDIKLLLFDVDGVMTDGGIIYSENRLNRGNLSNNKGENRANFGNEGNSVADKGDKKPLNNNFSNAGESEIKAFNAQDGMGISLARKAGLMTGILTGRESAMVKSRGQELNMTVVVQGTGVEKLEPFCKILKELGLMPNQVAYMGDDIQDLPVLLRAGLSVAPENARPDVKERVHLITQCSGGHGAVREMIEYILKAQGKWQGLVDYFCKDE